MGNREKLSECEEIIMSILLESNHDLTLMEITEQAEEYGKEWKLQTTATFVKRMERKDYISIYKVGRYSHFHPEVSLEEYRKEKLYGIRELLLFKNYREMADFIKDMQ